MLQLAWLVTYETVNNLYKSVLLEPFIIFTNYKKTKKGKLFLSYGSSQSDFKYINL